MISGTEGYAEAAPWLLSTRLTFDEVHEPIRRLIPSEPSRILDIGAGPGHDAATLADRGHTVVAAEPTLELYHGAIGLYGRERVLWIEDGLPELNRVRALGERFDFILMSGVWMHLDAAERERSMPCVTALLQRGGVLALSLRHGLVPAGRRMFEVGAEETIALARRCGLEAIHKSCRDSIQPHNRAAGVTWTFLGFRRGR